MLRIEMIIPPPPPPLIPLGHETTAATLGFTLAHLAASPEWEARCVEEVRTVLAGRAEPSYADLGRLPTLEACFKESLRLHPPVGSVARDAMVDTTLGGGRWLVRRGQTVMCNIYAVHRRPDVWGGEFGDVKEWNPARFMPGKRDKKGEGGGAGCVRFSSCFFPHPPPPLYTSQAPPTAATGSPSCRSASACGRARASCSR